MDRPGGGAQIRTPDQRLRVFVSSTLGELADERRAVADAVTALRLTPVMFELGARPHPPRDLYRAYLAQSDVFVGLYWQRYGWIGPGMPVSGLEDEFTLARGLPRLLYVKEPAPDRESRLAELLARIDREGSVSYRVFGTAAELGELVRDDLATLLSERFTAAPRPAVRVRPDGPRPLPVGTTSLIGREQAIDGVAGLAGRPEVRLVTLTGPGGIGKTRLAVAVGERLRDRFGPNIAFVPLVSVAEPDLMLSRIGQALGAGLAPASVPLEALVERIGDDRWLLILDNLEQLVGAAGDLAEVLSRCAGVTILATSRTVLGLRGEREYPVPPLPLPGEPETMSVEELAAAPAVALFLDRARAVRPDFALTEGNAAAVVEICRRMEGLPLAIELAAARVRLIDPDAVLRRLSRSLDALGAGAVDMPERQRTLRATVEWSVGLLDDAERSLLETAAVFVDGWVVEAAARVAELDEDRTLELTEALARHSLIYLDHTDDGPRSRMLETVRVYVAERLAARPDAAEVERRHAEHFRALALRADEPLRRVGQHEWADRLQAEAGNLAAATRWYLAHDRVPLAHLFRVLWIFWTLRDHLGAARSWIDQLLPSADAFDPEARAELIWTAAATAFEVGDDAAALSARERLEPLLDTIEDPFLRAVSRLPMAWTSAILGDLDGAVREATESLRRLRGQDEPFWTALAVATASSAEIAVGRYADAQGHLAEVVDLARRFDNAWLAAGARAQLGILALAQRRLDDAWTLLNEGLDLSVSISDTRGVTLCLMALARYALIKGEPERAALLSGAAVGLRQRAALGVWPSQRRGEAELMDRIRAELGGDRLDQIFRAAGRLNQRDAVAAARAAPS